MCKEMKKVCCENYRKWVKNDRKGDGCKYCRYNSNLDGQYGDCDFINLKLGVNPRRLEVSEIVETINKYDTDERLNFFKRFRLNCSEKEKQYYDILMEYRDKESLNNIIIMFKSKVKLTSKTKVLLSLEDNSILLTNVRCYNRFNNKFYSANKYKGRLSNIKSIEIRL